MSFKEQGGSDAPAGDPARPDTGIGKDQNQSSITRAVRSRLAKARGEPRVSARMATPAAPVTGFLSFLPRRAPYDLQFLGRTLLHAGLVGLGAGLIGAGF